MFLPLFYLSFKNPPIYISVLLFYINKIDSILLLCGFDLCLLLLLSLEKYRNLFFWSSWRRAIKHMQDKKNGTTPYCNGAISHEFLLHVFFSTNNQPDQGFSWNISFSLSLSLLLFFISLFAIFILLCYFFLFLFCRWNQSKDLCLCLWTEQQGSSPKTHPHSHVIVLYVHASLLINDMYSS